MVGWPPWSQSQHRSRSDRTRANIEEAKLLQLGYSQRLVRSFTSFNAFSFSLVGMSFLVSIPVTLSTSYLHGGASPLVWGWAMAVLFSLCQAIALSELAAAYPTSGGLYYCSYALAPAKLKGISCFVTGWINLLGEVALSSSVLYSSLEFIIEMYNLTAKLSGAPSFAPSPPAVLGMYLLFTLLNGLISSCGNWVSSFVATLCCIWQLICSFTFIVTLLVLNTKFPRAKAVFATWEQHSDITGIESPPYTFFIGLVGAHWSMTGWDGSMHLSEEVMGATETVPLAMISAVLVNGLFGWGLSIALMFCLQDGAALLGGTWNGASEICQQVFEARYGSSAGCSYLMYLIWVPSLGVPVVCNTICSRMLFAFSRDGAVPWASNTTASGVPLVAVWMTVALTMLLGVAITFHTSAFTAIASIAVVGISLSYVPPFFFRMVMTHDRAEMAAFLPGRFFLGIWGRVLCGIAITWIMFICSWYMLPVQYPATLANFNWTPLALLLVLSCVLVYWFVPKYGARHWFTGPQPNLGQMKHVSSYDDKSTERTVSQYSEVDYLLRKCANASELINKNSADIKLAVSRSRFGIEKPDGLNLRMEVREK